MYVVTFCCYISPFSVHVRSPKRSTLFILIHARISLVKNRPSFWEPSPGPSSIGCKAAWRHARLFLSLLWRIVLFTSRHLACTEVHSTEAPFSELAQTVFFACARRTWEKTSVIKGLMHWGRHPRHSFCRRPLADWGALSNVGATLAQRSQARATAKAGQPGVKGSVGCGGTRRSYGSLLLTCGRRRSSVCSRPATSFLLLSDRRLPLQPDWSWFCGMWLQVRSEQPKVRSRRPLQLQCLFPPRHVLRPFKTLVL